MPRRMSDERLRRLLGEMCDVIPEETTTAGYGRDSCILSTRLATFVLRDQGVRARPLACQLMAGNAAWAKRCAETLDREDRWPTEDEWTPEMWAVGVGYGRDPRDGDGRRRYDGHLIAIVENRYGLDLTRDQTSRPQRGFTTTPGYFPVTPEFLSGSPLAFWDGDAFMRYDPMPDERSFLTAPDWQEPARQRNSGAVPIRRIQQQLSLP